MIKYSKNELDVPNVDSASQSMKKSVNSEFQPTKKRKVEIGQPSTLFTKTKQFVSSFMSKKSNDESEHAENKIMYLFINLFEHTSILRLMVAIIEK